MEDPFISPIWKVNFIFDRIFFFWIFNFLDFLGQERIGEIQVSNKWSYHMLSDVLERRYLLQVFFVIEL